MSIWWLVKGIDIIKIIPDEYKESSILGIILTVGFICLAGILIANQVVLLFS